MTVRDVWVENDGVRLHLLESTGREPVLVIVPGLSENAEDYRHLMAELSPRRGAALSLRGRGRSDAPDRGYSLDDHVSDIEALVGSLELGPFCLMGCSRGAAYALAYATRHPDRLVGVVVGDYPPHHRVLPPEWADWFLSTTWRGSPVAERLAPRVVRAIQAEAEEVPLDLSNLSCPVLVLKGGGEGSMLDRVSLDQYEELADLEIRVLEDVGHDLHEAGPALVEAIEEFLDRVGANVH